MSSSKGKSRSTSTTESSPNNQVADFVDHTSVPTLSSSDSIAQKSHSTSAYEQTTLNYQDVLSSTTATTSIEKSLNSSVNPLSTENLGFTPITNLEQNASVAELRIVEESLQYEISNSLEQLSSFQKNMSELQQSLGNHHELQPLWDTSHIENIIDLVEANGDSSTINQEIFKLQAQLEWAHQRTEDEFSSSPNKLSFANNDISITRMIGAFSELKEVVSRLVVDMGVYNSLKSKTKFDPMKPIDEADLVSIPEGTPMNHQLQSAASKYQTAFDKLVMAKSNLAKQLGQIDSAQQEFDSQTTLLTQKLAVAQALKPSEVADSLLMKLIKYPADTAEIILKWFMGEEKVESTPKIFADITSKLDGLHDHAIKLANESKGEESRAWKDVANQSIVTRSAYQNYQNLKALSEKVEADYKAAEEHYEKAADHLQETISLQQKYAETQGKDSVADGDNSPGFFKSLLNYFKSSDTKASDSTLSVDNGESGHDVNPDVHSTLDDTQTPTPMDGF